MNEPLVSVLCLSMNHERYVEQGYGSVINQTYENIEILYLDNISSDNTFEISDKIFRESGFPYLGFKQLEGRGISANLNSLLKKAKGKYIAILSGDDWWDARNLEVKINCFQKNPEYGLVYGNGFAYYDKKKEKVLLYNEPQMEGNLFKHLLTGNRITAASVIIRRDVLDTVGFFDENSPVEDWELWLRIAEKFPIGYSHEPLIYYRITGSNLSSNFTFMNRGFEYIYQKYESYPEIKEAKKSIMMGQAYQLADTAPGWKSLGYILKHFQWNLKYTKHLVRCLAGMIGIRIPKRGPQIPQ